MLQPVACPTTPASSLAWRRITARELVRVLVRELGRVLVLVPVPVQVSEVGWSLALVVPCRVCLVPWGWGSRTHLP